MILLQIHTVINNINNNNNNSNNPISIPMPTLPLPPLLSVLFGQLIFSITPRQSGSPKKQTFVAHFPSWMPFPSLNQQHRAQSDCLHPDNVSTEHKVTGKKLMH